VHKSRRNLVGIGGLKPTLQSKDLVELGILALLPEKGVNSFGFYRLLFYYLSELKSKLFFGKISEMVGAAQAT